MIATNQHLTVNSVNLSSFIFEMKAGYEADSEENTRMGGSFKAHEPKLPAFRIEGTLYQTHGAAGPDETIRPLARLGTLVTVVAKQNNSSGTGNTFSVTNMMFTGDWDSIAGQVDGKVLSAFKFIPTIASVITES